jgi:predicted dienelactone hydrolase
MSSDGAKFPVLLFSHGLGSEAPTYASLIEDLVSHGYVVVAISHTYDASAVTFPDGTTLNANMSWLPPPPDPDAGDAAVAAFQAVMHDHVATWTADARFVLDQVTQWQANDPEGVLTGRLDLDHVGMFGHSYGGATSAEVCALDPRFKAGIDLDGTLFSPAETDGGTGRSIATPFMLQLNELHGLTADDSGRPSTRPSPTRSIS